MIKCEELLKLDIFKNIKLVAGKNGLSRMISWPYPMHAVLFEDWITGGELLLTSGYQSDFDNNTLKKLLKQAIDHNLSGIIVESGPHMTEIEEDVIALADQYDFPLFWISSPIHFIDITKAISYLIIQDDVTIEKGSAFWEFLFSEELISSESILEWAGVHNIQLGKVHTAAIISVADNETFLKDTRTLLTSIQRTVISLLNEKQIAPITHIIGHFLVFLLTDTNEAELQKTVRYFESILGILENFHEKQSIFMSFGRDFVDPANIKESFKDASKAMKLLQTGTYDRNITKYCDIGSYQLLFEIGNRKEMLRFRDAMLKEIYEYDLKYNAELFLTLGKYLSNNGSVSKTAQDLIVHRNTLLYRLNKIKSLTGFDLDDYRIRRDFLNAFLILNLHPF